MSLQGFPVSEDTAAVLRDFAVWRIAAKDYQGVVIADPTSGVPAVVSAAGALATKAPKGAKTFTDPAPTSSAAVVLAALATRIAATIANVGTVDVYLGKDNTVTTTNGLKLVAGATMSDDVTTDAWWAITASGTADLRVCEVA